MVNEILRIGDARLRQRSTSVTAFDTPELQSLVADMHETMAAANGAGLAAIQIGVAQRVMIFGFEHNSRYPDAEPVPYTVLINPEFEPLSDSRKGDWEGCLSVPGMRGFVQRYSEIRYRGQDLRGKWIEREVEGFHARVFQHEFDHLQGVLYPDLIEDPHLFGFVEELSASGLI